MMEVVDLLKKKNEKKENKNSFYQREIGDLSL